jgi:hypothetical protein
LVPGDEYQRVILDSISDGWYMFWLRRRIRRA